MKILFVITGGIAEYKVVEAVRYQVKAGNAVKVVMTKMAEEFVTPLTFATLTNEPVYDDFKSDLGKPVAHVALADWADQVVVAPATANFIAKMALGIADDFASTVVLASSAKKRVLPAMNVNMWQNPAVQRNLTQLKADGVEILEPVVGELAEGYSGKGRFPSAEVVNQFISQPVGSSQQLAGYKVVVTAGGTREAIDPVRFIGNRSSGKMGFALAQQAAAAGATVTLITGPTNLSLDTHSKIKRIDIEDVAELKAALDQELKNADVLIMAAAVSDYRVAKVSTHKLKKHDFKNGLQLELVENPDILATLDRPDRLKYVVGFAAETDDLLENATGKMQRKGLNMVVANDVGNPEIGFNVDDNAVTILRPDQRAKVIAKQSKVKIAEAILKIVSEELK
ncbi:bifunctional phosphopantothenoylcysteine decarboxylase/phosphopantothenate--cysteine ligase CoaBC [Pediococcus acidilactici]|jgi:phosphopantothenoylcysteine decarboxylase/phosphopantothenate--cysteine ligase|uniref:bifunctional phosphopantothenoylcysteine decarboxylase/phosphopantothenate--cysteine ligase CoaBC n=1 Tax=Pediococcus acidilactici TaxID=1254 RepID=UPI0009476795|nr:bifunctional phosphopantothenoylcysteine decarboxylase/phosphopantothenate--cysteine ligase CoaBC [Pediococcus acidilactici]APR28322.1 DNA/pantothenate metabolism flavoprotein [Pediococcus acidilactici]KAF0341789.1 bifunctional phosphopantothenoylcysteine decarboxylase/phosphopantothenate--cysteine ligase CoaBC [Pediococcus acidilactici]KAF0353454.1 bifunctional phosphopantothenoylcysteine decarboxylase/phosphopantothenate--cysteine ligase CoaBC [Pediococcus acidilactici]KAF0357184.1 bifunct